jgi:hypothetical protein
MKLINILILSLFWIAIQNNILFSQIKILDEFDNSVGWTVFNSDGVDLSISGDAGLHGNAIRFDYDFTKGTGYGGIQKIIPIDLPENFEFTFYVKAESPANNFEIKFIDSTGNNVWWVNNRNYEFPKTWKKIRLKKRHIGFAWGPIEDHSFKRVDRIEFTIASYMGGKGTIWIDDLKFEQLLPETNVYPKPIVTSSEIPANMVVDNLQNTDWVSQKTSNEFLLVNFNTRREFGGLKIDWKKNLHAQSFEILLSDDGNSWDKVYSVNSNLSDVSFIRLPEAEAKYLRINLIKSNSNDGFGVNEISFLYLNDATTKNNFLLYVAKNSKRGDYPRYFANEASFWTVLGVNNDVKEAMINVDGMVEVDKSAFSIEPMLKIGNEYFNWNNVTTTQSLEENYLPIPKVDWNCSDVNLDIEAFANGDANKNSTLYLKYKITNNSSSSKDGKLFLLLRPYQVNPHYQWLNDPGGVGKINSLIEKDGRIFVNDDKVIIPLEKYDSFSAITFDDGNIVELIKENKDLNIKSVVDVHNLASGFLEYNFNLNPSEDKIVYLIVPFYREVSLNITKEFIEKRHIETVNFWKSEVNHIKFNLPESADRIVNTYKSNLAYILINRDNVGIQPGSRSYERSWIRDGALTSSALLKSSIVTEVKDYINWYASHQYENGKVPCVVDKRGPDPTPENDSHGELIYLIREYFNFTKDTAFLQSKTENVLKAVDYMQSLIAERSTDHFKNGNDSVKAHYGLITESISHEGYSEKPMHSYWDDFFVMKGFKDAVEIQKILGNNEEYERIKKIRDTFKSNLYNSINLTMKYKKINYIPGCVEKGDFDATSTTIALTPCNELKHLPKPEVYNTFDKYFDYFQKRRDNKIEWVNYTPYENRLIGSFILLDQPERAHQLIDYFLNNQVPHSWNEFAEVVWKDKKTAGFIGDIPHTWVGSDFINAIRTLFVYENEYDESLVLGAALYQDWIDAPNGMSIEHLPTYYGEISYSIKKENEKYTFSVYGDVKLPKNGIKIKNFNGSKLPVSVTVNGKKIKSFTKNEITVKDFPAKVIIEY